MCLFVLDLDDSLVNTTQDLQGSWERMAHLTLVPGAREFLAWCRGRAVLLSAGQVAIQMRKLEVFGIQGHFDHTIIVPTPEGKAAALRQLVVGSKLPPYTFVVVGDSIVHEVRAGNALGCTTVRMHLPNGKYAGLKPQEPLQEPDHTVHDCYELLELVRTWP